MITLKVRFYASSSFWKWHWQNWFMIYLKKKKYLGLSKNVFACFKSYLSERKFKLNSNTSYASPSNLICGVWQASILGAILILLYTYDLPQFAVTDLLLYPDDTCMVFQDKNVTEIEKQLLRYSSSLCDWFVDNKLRINFGQDKTKSTLFGTKFEMLRS